MLEIFTDEKCAVLIDTPNNAVAFKTPILQPNGKVSFATFVKGSSAGSTAFSKFGGKDFSKNSFS